jgi:hypothetical protein
MTNQNAHAILCKALATAAVFGVAGFLYYLWACGVSVAGLLVAVGMTMFVSAMTVAGAVTVLRSKEQ